MNVKDSKKLSAKKREEIYSMVQKIILSILLKNHQINLLINLESKMQMKKY
jgi:ribonuclease HII